MITKLLFPTRPTTVVLPQPLLPQTTSHQHTYQTLLLKLRPHLPNPPPHNRPLLAPPTRNPRHNLLITTQHLPTLQHNPTNRHNPRPINHALLASRITHERHLHAPRQSRNRTHRAGDHHAQVQRCREACARRVVAHIQAEDLRLRCVSRASPTDRGGTNRGVARGVETLQVSQLPGTPGECSNGGLRTARGGFWSEDGDVLGGLRRG